MKRTMSVLTAILLSFCIIIAPITTVAAVGETTETESGGENLTTTENELSAKGTNGFGNLLANVIQTKENEIQENLGNNIFSVEINDNTAYVDFETTENCTIVVGIYDEAGVQMITSTSVEVTTEQEEATISLDSEKMPDYLSHP